MFPISANLILSLLDSCAVRATVKGEGDRKMYYHHAILFMIAHHQQVAMTFPNVNPLQSWELAYLDRAKLIWFLHFFHISSVCITNGSNLKGTLLLDER